MRSRVKNRKDLLAKALGASRTVELKSPGHGPFGVMELAEEVEKRIKPGKGKGRPTDDSLVIRRLVGFRTSVWNILKKEAAGLSEHTRHSVSPSQLASLLVEKQIRQVKLAGLRRVGSSRKAGVSGKREKATAIYKEE